MCRYIFLLACLLGAFLSAAHADDVAADIQSNNVTSQLFWPGWWFGGDLPLSGGSSAKTASIRVAVPATAQAPRRVWSSGEVSLFVECSENTAAPGFYDVLAYFTVSAPASTTRWVAQCNDPADSGSALYIIPFSSASGRCLVTRLGSEADATVFSEPFPAVAATDGRWASLDRQSMYWATVDTVTGAATCYLVGQLRYVPAGSTWFTGRTNPWLTATGAAGSRFKVVSALGRRLR
jgi:hypothetical protein